MTTASPQPKALDLEEVAAWKVNCPDAGEQKVALKAGSRGFNWSARDVEAFWEAVVSGRDLGSFSIRRGPGLPVLE
ncbi:MAG: hypothetical protein K2G99_07560, partial [Desulfovibrio sp.]|nr:hypothetical protein [Desulfovibrio sp.]